MGVDRRDYKQEKREPGLAGWWAVLGLTPKLIILNVVVWMMWQTRASFMPAHFLTSWSHVFEQGRVWTLVTAAFSHEGGSHLLWNMLYLLWFGSELETIYGKRNFLLLYLHGGITASLAHIAWERGWGHDVPCLGASGAIMAVVIVTAIFYPHRTINWFLFLPLPLWFLALFKLLGDFAGLFHRTGTSHAGHLGGALAGVFFWWFDLRLFASPGQEWSESPSAGVGGTLRSWVSSVLPRRRRGEVVKFPKVDGDTALEVDELLRKIHREGMASLTPEEREFLNKASDRYRGG